MRTMNIAWALAAGLALALPLIADVSPVATTTTTTTSAHKHASKANARAKPNPATEAMMKQSDCFTCHSATHKIIGPSYKDVAKKYRHVPGAEEKLVKKVRDGGSGNWGEVPMVAHPQLSNTQLHAMVKWVLAH